MATPHGVAILRLTPTPPEPSTRSTTDRTRRVRVRDILRAGGAGGIRDLRGEQRNRRGCGAFLAGRGGGAGGRSPVDSRDRSLMVRNDLMTGTWCRGIAHCFGGHSKRETPGHIPNPEAKTLCADGTAGGTLWESRTPPDLT